MKPRYCDWKYSNLSPEDHAREFERDEMLYKIANPNEEEPQAPADIILEWSFGIIFSILFLFGVNWILSLIIAGIGAFISLVIASKIIK